MTGFSKKTLVRAVFTPQVLLAFLVCSVLAFRYFRQETVSVQASTASTLPVNANVDIVSSDYELVLYDTSQLQQAKFVTISSENKPNAKIASLIDALKNEYATLWPESLSLSSLFEVSEDGNSQIVLDFSYANDSALSVNDEWRLLKSLTGTLSRAGFSNLKILMNHQESDVFLNFIALD